MNNWILPAFVTLLLWGVGPVISKISLAYINPISAAIYRTVGMCIVALIALIFIGFRPDVHAKGIALSILVGLTFGVSVFTYYYALLSGKISTVVVFTALFPIISILYGFFVLKEPIVLKEGIGMIFAFTAILLFAI